MSDRVQAGGRFVEEQQSGFHRQGADDLDLALQAVGQALRQFVGVLGQS